MFFMLSWKLKLAANKIHNFYIQCKVGDKCTVEIPKLDRQGIQHPRLPCQIIKIYEKTGFFEIASSAGIIDCKFRGGDLTKYNGELNINLKKKVCLRNAAIFL